MTDQAQTPPDPEATAATEVETTQAGVAPTAEAVAPIEAEAPPTPPLTEVHQPAPVAEPPLSSFETFGPSAASAPTPRPEIPIGASFAGGLVLALILKRLAK